MSRTHGSHRRDGASGRTPIVVTLSLAAVSAVAGSWLGLGSPFASDERDSAKQPRVSVLERPFSERDRLPERIRQLPAGDRFGPPESARFAQAANGRSYYVVPAATDELCLVAVQEQPPSSAGTCERRSRLETKAIYLVEDTGTALFIAGVVPDEVTAVRYEGKEYGVRENTFAFETNVVGDRLFLTTRSGRKRVVDVATLRDP